VIGYVAEKRVIAPALHTDTGAGAQLHASSEATLSAALRRLVDAAQRAGAIRAEIGFDDVARMMAGICGGERSARMGSQRAAFAGRDDGGAARNALAKGAGNRMAPPASVRLQELPAEEPMHAWCAENDPRLVDQSALDRMERRIYADPSLMRIRRCTVEHPFGTIKRMSGGGRFLTRGLRKVKAEAALSVLAFNIIHAVNAYGSEKMVGRD
jgi:hypothetical protein